MTAKEEIMAAVKSDKTIASHIINYTWTSGSSTTVYPIMLWPDDVCLQMDTTRNLFQKAIGRVMEKYSHLFRYGYFSKNDGSCPAEITFSYTDETATRLKNHE